MPLIDLKPFPDTLTRPLSDKDGQPSDKAEYGFLNAIKGEPELTVFGALGVLALAAGLLVVASYFF
jgi:hypothetical protein